MSKKMYMVNSLGAKFLHMLNNSTLEEAKERDNQAGLNTPTEELIRVMKMLERNVGILDLFIKQFGYNNCFNIEDIKSGFNGKLNDESEPKKEMLLKTLDMSLEFLISLDAIQEVNVNVR